MNPTPEAVALGEAAPEPDRAAIGIARALAVCRQPAHLRRTCLIAVVVGCVLTLINQLDVLLEGKATAFTAVKVGLNFCVPFVVSNLGILAATKVAHR